MMKSLMVVLTLVITASLFAQSNPAPFVNVPLAPGSALPGGPAFTLTVNGTGFLSGATVDWNGSGRSTKFVSSSQLTAQISAADIAKTGTASVTVQNPGQKGSSNVVYFPVRRPFEPVTFAPHSRIATSIRGDASVVATGDFNGDGNQDVAIATQEHGRNQIDVYLGDGRGNFSAPIVSLGQWGCCSPVGLIVADFNGDGHLDVAVSTRNGDGNDGSTSYLMLGRGDGTLVKVGKQPGPICTAVAAGDVNGDGFTDLITSCLSDEDDAQDVYVYLTDLGGHLALAQDLHGVGGWGAALGDFNGDGKLDLAIAGNPVIAGNPLEDGKTANGVWVALGNGDGTFQQPVRYSTTNQALNVYVADVNGDGKLDLVTDGICTLYGNGDGTFTSGPCTSGDLSGSLTAMADFDGDGTLDFATYSGFDTELSIYPGSSTGTFGAPWNYPLQSGLVPGNSTLAVGDFMGNGAVDFVGGLWPSITLFGQAVAGVSPTLLNFQNGQELAVTFTNNLSQTLTLGKIEIKGAGPFSYKIASTNCGTELGGGLGCQIQVKYQPGGKITSYLYINYEGIGSPQIVPLTVE
jgi:hypothetical protein